MTVWICIVLGAAVVGTACAWIDRRWLSLAAAAAVPWLGFLSVLLVEAYVLPYRGGGATLWPIAQLFGGTAAAGIGLAACLVWRALRRANAS